MTDKAKEIDHKAHEFVKMVKKKILHENRFFVDERFITYLDMVIEQSVVSIEEGEFFYRARIYKEEDVYQKWRDGIASSKQFKGYSADDSGAHPKPQRAGRANPKGISYLYAATDIDTALLEVCNKRKTPVSVAKVVITKKMKVLDLASSVRSSGGTIHSQEEQDELDFAFAVGCEIASEMNRTFFDDEEYILTQFICEYVKKKGIDGILYQSTTHAGEEFEPREELSIGNNIVIFNKDNYTIASSDLYLVENICIKKEQFRINDE